MRWKREVRIHAARVAIVKKQPNWKYVRTVYDWNYFGVHSKLIQFPRKISYHDNFRTPLNIIMPDTYIGD